MPITPQQREARRSHLGSSDMAAIMGLDPWRNAHDVYLEKTGALAEWDGNEATKLGNLLEPVVLAMAADRLGSLIVPETRIVASCPVLAANTDSLVEATGEPVEAKTSSLVGPGGAKDEWGEEGTDEVPLRVIVQAHCHELAWERDVCHVPALIGRRGFVMYVIPRNADVAGAICERATQFWEKNVLAHVPPDMAPHLEIARRMKRQPNKTADIAGELVAAWQSANERKLAAQKEADAAQAAILAALGDAEAGLPTGGGVGAVTYFEQHRKEYTVAATSFRVLRYKKGGL